MMWQAMSAVPVLQVLAPGAGASIQDLGRSGWKRFGIPPGGAMDSDSARKANLLVGNEEAAPVLELLFTGARFRVLSAAELAITGAETECEYPSWRNFCAEAGQEIAFGRLVAGVWTYLAVQGGFAGSRWFGSASVDPRAGLGGAVAAGRSCVGKTCSGRTGFPLVLFRNLFGSASMKCRSSAFGVVRNGRAFPRMLAHVF